MSFTAARPRQLNFGNPVLPISKNAIVLKESGVHNSYLRTSEAIDLLVIVLSISLSWLLPLPWPGPQNFWLNLLIGGLLVIPAVWLIIRCKKDLGIEGQKSEPGFTTTTLVTTGIFANTRNPIYLASLILYAAAGFIFQTLWPLALIPLAALVFYRWMIRPEEQFLAEQFQDQYREYCARVGRWWTFK